MLVCRCRPSRCHRSPLLASAAATVCRSWPQPAPSLAHATNRCCHAVAVQPRLPGATGRSVPAGYSAAPRPGTEPDARLVAGGVGKILLCQTRFACFSEISSNIIPNVQIVLVRGFSLSLLIFSSPLIFSCHEIPNLSLPPTQRSFFPAPLSYRWICCSLQRCSLLLDSARVWLSLPTHARR